MSETPEYEVVTSEAPLAPVEQDEFALFDAPEPEHERGGLL